MRRPNDGTRDGESRCPGNQGYFRYFTHVGIRVASGTGCSLHTLRQMRRSMPDGTATRNALQIGTPQTVRTNGGFRCSGLHRMRFLLLHMPCFAPVARLHQVGQRRGDEDNACPQSIGLRGREKFRRTKWYLCGWLCFRQFNICAEIVKVVHMI